MTCNDLSSTLLGIAALTITAIVFVHVCPACKRWLGIRLLAAAEADEFRKGYYQSKLRDLTRDHAKVDDVKAEGI